MIQQKEDGTRRIKPQCADSPTGKHEAQHYNISHAFVYGVDEWVIEVHCKHCGQMGTITINPLNIKWG